MLSFILLSALVANAAPTKRQALGDTPGQLIMFPTGSDNPYGAQNRCLAANPSGQTGLQDGTPVGFVDCHSVQTELSSEGLYGLWNIVPGNQLSVQLVGTNFCLDAGSNPGSDPSVPAKVWTCYPGAPQQQFYYTETNHIAVTGYTPCLDYSPSNGATTFTACGSNGNNGDIQSFMLQSVGSGSTPSSSPSASASPSASSTSSSAPPSTTGINQTNQQIYWQNGDDVSQCLTVTDGNFYNGSPVGIARCSGAANQGWNYVSSGVTSIQVAGQNYCLDFGSGGGSDGTQMKIWQCYPGLFQQTLYYTNDIHIAVYNGNQCLDVQAGTSNVQSWQCSGSDTNQRWTPQNN